MRLYFDVSCLNRPFDDQRQARVRLEAVATLHLLQLVDDGVHQHVSSEMAVIEINAIKNPQRRNRILAMLPTPAVIMGIDDAMLERAELLQTYGLVLPDALHVAAAEAQKADALLTCDDRMLSAFARHRRNIFVPAFNPILWINEHD